MTELEKSKAIIQYIADAKKATPVELYTDEEIKNTNVDDVNKLSSNFNNMKDNAYVCVLGSKEKILSNSDLFSKTIEIK